MHKPHTVWHYWREKGRMVRTGYHLKTFCFSVCTAGRMLKQQGEFSLLTYAGVNAEGGFELSSACKILKLSTVP